MKSTSTLSPEMRTVTLTSRGSSVIPSLSTKSDATYVPSGRAAMALRMRCSDWSRSMVIAALSVSAP